MFSETRINVLGYMARKVHGVTSQQIAVLLVSAVTTLNLTSDALQSQHYMLTLPDQFLHEFFCCLLLCEDLVW